MIFVAGRRLVGRVEAHAGTFVVTEFVHAYYLPLVPVRSHLVVDADPAGGIRKSLPIGLHRLSVIAGYLRAWCIAGAGLCLLVALGLQTAQAIVWLVLAVALIGIGAWSRSRLGLLSDERRAQYEAYASLTRVPADAALLSATAETFRASLHANVAEGARGMMATGYRTALDPTNDWAEVALDPTVRDRAFLQACLTLARLDWARARGVARTKLGGQHHRIWEKLKAVEGTIGPTIVRKSMINR
jgi:hypothetical protein